MKTINALRFVLTLTIIANHTSALAISEDLKIRREPIAPTWSHEVIKSTAQYQKVRADDEAAVSNTSKAFISSMGVSSVGVLMTKAGNKSHNQVLAKSGIAVGAIGAAGALASAGFGLIYAYPGNEEEIAKDSDVKNSIVKVLQKMSGYEDGLDADLDKAILVQSRYIMRQAASDEDLGATAFSACKDLHEASQKAVRVGEELNGEVTPHMLWAERYRLTFQEQSTFVSECQDLLIKELAEPSQKFAEENKDAKINH